MTIEVAITIDCCIDNHNVCHARLDLNNNYKLLVTTTLTQQNKIINADVFTSSCPLRDSRSGPSNVWTTEEKYITRDSRFDKKSLYDFTTTSI